MNRRGTNVFLAEAIVMTVVLTASISICLGVFSKASEMKREADDLTEASSLVYSACQCYMSTGSIAETEKLMEKCPPKGDILLTITDNKKYVTVSASKNGKVLFSSPVKVGIK